MEPPLKTKPTAAERARRNAALAMRFTDMGIRMAVTIAVGTLLGKWLDGKLVMQKPIFTAVLALLSVGGALFMVIRTAQKPVD